MATLTDLILDVQIYLIANFLSASTLRALALTCKSLNSLVAPVIFRNVDLTFDGEIAPVPFAGGALGTVRFRARQAVFWTAVQLNASLAKCVHSMKLDVRLYPRVHWELNERDREEVDELIGTYLPLLTNLTDLSLSFPEAGECTRAIPFPHSLTRLSLDGMVPEQLAASLMHNSAHLVSLSLKQLFPEDVALAVYRLIAGINLPSLRYLTLSAGDIAPSHQEDTYHIWSDILNSVRISLEELRLGWSYAPAPEERLLVEVVRPVLANGTWPHLRTLFIEGPGLHMEAWTFEESAPFTVHCGDSKRVSGSSFL